MNLYLTHLILNPRSNLVRRDLADTQQMHRTIMSMFPQTSEREDPRAQFGVLYRVGDQNSAGNVELLLQSLIAPQTESLPDGYLSRPVETREVGTIYEEIQVGNAFRFRLDANPTKSLAAGEHERGRRIPITIEAEQLNWFSSHAAGWGFEIVEARVSRAQSIVGRLKDAASRKLMLTQFEGIIRVTDVDAFETSIALGLGRGRAFGLGLLTIARAT